jgi:hypothetical protein
VYGDDARVHPVNDDDESFFKRVKRYVKQQREEFQISLFDERQMTQYKDIFDMKHILKNKFEDIYLVAPSDLDMDEENSEGRIGFSGEGEESNALMLPKRTQNEGVIMHHVKSFWSRGGEVSHWYLHYNDRPLINLSGREEVKYEYDLFKLFKYNKNIFVMVEGKYYVLCSTKDAQRFLTPDMLPQFPDLPPCALPSGNIPIQCIWEFKRNTYYPNEHKYIVTSDKARKYESNSWFSQLGNHEKSIIVVSSIESTPDLIFLHHEVKRLYLARFPNKIDTSLHWFSELIAPAFQPGNASLILSPFRRRNNVMRSINDVPYETEKITISDLEDKIKIHITEIKDIQILHGIDVKELLRDKQQSENCMFQLACQYNTLPSSIPNENKKLIIKGGMTKKDVLEAINMLNIHDFEMFDNPCQCNMISLSSPSSTFLRLTSNPFGYATNLLANLYTYFNVSLGEILNNNNNFIDGQTELDQVLVYYEQLVPITHDVYEQKGRLVTSRRPDENKYKAHFVFTSTMNISHGEQGKRNKEIDTPKNLEAKLRFLLKAAYTSAYLAATQCKAKCLYLTLVGGGWFGNPLNLILDAINEVHEEYTPQFDVKLLDYQSVVEHDKKGKLIPKKG